MRTIGYVRVSTHDQADNGVSLDAQEAKIQAWAELVDAEGVEIFRDEGISGKRSDNRPGLLAALEAIGAGDALVVHSLSRLSRSTRDTIDLAEALSEKGADLVSLSEKIDTTTAAGKMVFRILAVLAEFERDQISDRSSSPWPTNGPWGKRPAATCLSGSGRAEADCIPTPESKRPWD